MSTNLPYCGRMNCFTAPSFPAQQLEHRKNGLLPRASRARSESACLISGESEDQCWVCLLQATNSQEDVLVSVLAVACPSMSLVLQFCCALASSHSDQRLLRPEKQERPASLRSCSFFCLYVPLPNIPPILLTTQIPYCFSQKRNIPVPYKHFSA